MNKFACLICAFALAVGLMQCRKPVMPDYNDYSKQYLTFTTGDNDSKGEIYQPDDAYSKLKYKWKSGDKIFVYASADGSFSKSHGSKFCGVLNIKEGMETTSGIFGGTIEIPDGMVKGISKIRFVNYGGSVNLNANTGVASVDFNTQDGTLQTISGKIVAMCDLDYEDNGKYNGGKLIAQFAIFKFSFECFLNVPITLDNAEKTGIAIDTYGEITYTSGASTTITLNNKSNEYFTVLMPNENQTEYVFSQNGGAVVVKTSLVAGKFYSNTGNAVKIYSSSVVDALPGKFTVNSDGKQVRFAKGNLWYGPKTSGATPTWNFEDNQWGYKIISSSKGHSWDPDHVCHFSWNNYTNRAYSYNITAYSGSYTNANSLFSNVDNQQSSEPNPSFEVDGIKGVYRALVGGGSSGELDYIFNKRNNHDNLRGLATVNGICGLVILPDDFDYSGSGFESTLNDYTKNQYSGDAWKSMESAGAVFLPVVGYRTDSNGLLTKTVNGYYWASNHHATPGFSYPLVFSSTAGINIDATNRYDYYGYCIRLVCDVVPSGIGFASPFDSGDWNN